MSEELNADALNALVEEDVVEAERDEAAEADQADFEAGFHGTATSEAREDESSDQDGAGQDEVEDEVEAEKEAPQEAAKAEAPPEPAPAEKSKLQQMEERLRKLEGRNGQLMRDNEALNKQVKTLTEKPAPKEPTSAELLAAAMAGGEKLKNLKGEFPEFSDAIEELAVMVSGTMDKTVTRQVAAIRKEMSEGMISKAEMENRVKQVYDEAVMESSHRGWRKTLETDQFQEWYKAQGDDVKTLAQSEDVYDAIELMDRYAKFASEKSSSGVKGLTFEDDSRNNKRKQSEERLRRAVPATSGARQPPVRMSSEEEEFDAAFRRARGM